MILFTCAVVFSKLTIEISDELCEPVSEWDLSAKKSPLAEIATCEPIRVRWWYGCAIHPTPFGWLYNVARWNVVVITLRNGRKFALAWTIRGAHQRDKRFNLDIILPGRGTSVERPRSAHHSLRGPHEKSRFAFG